MTPLQPSPRDFRLVVLVNRYATPFAILLVVLGIVLSSPQGSVRNMSIALLAFSIFFNVMAVGVIRSLSESMPWIKKARLLINLAVNFILVYILGPFWPPMWLLLALTPIATAIYEGPAQTLLTSAGTSALIVIIHLIRGGNTPHQWGETISYAAFIILMSMLINELTQASYPNHPQDRDRN
jgi:hypothetical protein